MFSLEGILVSLLAGALIGLEREHTKKQHKVGMRTFALMSLLGYVASSFPENPFLLDIGFGTACAFSLLLYFYRTRKPKVGFTTSLSVVLVFLIGVIAGKGFVQESIYLSVIITTLLYLGRKTHRFVEHLTETEVQDFIELMIILGLVYPLMPEQVLFYGITIGLKSLWALVIILAGLNFATYAGAKLMSVQKELSLVVLLTDSTPGSGMLSELYSQDKRNFPTLKALFPLLVFGPFVRNLVLASFFMPALLPKSIALILISAPWFWIAYKVSLPKKRKKIEVRVRSPFNVKEAVKIGVIIFIVLTLLSLFKHTSGGVLVASALGGFGNGAAATVSVLSAGIPEDTVLLAVTLASTTSALASFFMLWVLGAGRIVRENLKYSPVLLVPLAVALAIT